MKKKEEILEPIEFARGLAQLRNKNRAYGYKGRILLH